MDLTELADRAEITQLLHAYCDFVDRSELAALLELFTDDVELDVGNGAVFTGQPAVRAALITLVGRWTTTNHHCSTVVFQRYDGVSASTVSYIHAFHNHPGRDESMRLWGRYCDELDKVGSSWKIRVRRLRVAGVQMSTASLTPDRFEGFPRAALPNS